MVQLGTKRQDLVLYGVLLVLPTVVLAWLHWHQLIVDHRKQLADVPREAGDAARRLRDSIVSRVRELIESENQRPYYHYKDAYFPEGTIGTDLAFIPSPLIKDQQPDGILAWFTYDPRPGWDTEVQVFSGSRDGSEEWLARREEVQQSIAELVLHDAQEGPLHRFGRINGLRSQEVALTVAAINQSPEQDVDCLLADLPALQELSEETITVHVFSFHLRFYLDSDDVPRIVATRRVLIAPNTKMREMPACFDSLGWGATIVQGFFIEPTWLFGELAQSRAGEVLDSSDRLIGPGEAEPSPDSVDGLVSINLVRDLEMETYRREDESYGVMKVAVSSRDIESRFRSQSMRLLGVSAMLLISLGTGMVLLLKSVRRDLEQASRTENFVSAVTHELRTPISSIRLYGEMLRDGWTTEADKRREYYERIVGETERLETTVDRVLEKGHISSTDLRPEPNDVSVMTMPILTDLRQKCSTDLDHRLARDLPKVMLNRDSLRSILTNLVENARKYAPVPEGNEADRILVVTRLRKRQVVLEVADRGPGIPSAERERIFEAFYRVGNEATRTAQGTGLGLHLVALHARSMGAKVKVLNRKGGGTLFRITLKKAQV